MKLTKLTILALAALPLFASCAGKPKSRIKGDNEDSLVDDSRAGIATYDRLIAGSMKNLLGEYTNRILAGEAAQGVTVAFAGIQNQTNERLGQWQGELEQLITKGIADYRGFTPVAPLVVKAVLRKTGQRVDDLVIPGERDKFLALLRREDNAVQGLVFAFLTGGDSRAEGVREQRYRLTLQLIDTESGSLISETAEITKEYNG